MEIEMSRNLVTRIVSCVVQMVKDEMCFMKKHNITTGYDFDSMQIERTALILAMLICKSNTELTTVFAKGLFYTFGPLLKEVETDDFVKDLTVSVSSYVDVISTFDGKIDNYFSTAHSSEDTDFAVNTYWRSYCKVLIFALYDYEDNDIYNPINLLSNDERIDLCNIVLSDYNKFFVV